MGIAMGVCIHGVPAIAQDSPGTVAFKRFDKNGDGQISREEAKGTAAAARFDVLDKNQDGFLTPEEVPRGRAAAPTPANNSAAAIVTKMDIRYAEVPPGVDANLLSLDVYAPKDAKDLPVMIYIHGGGWRTGDKRAVGVKPGYFTSRGFVFVSLNYRLVPAVDLLTQLQDSANAIGWVKQNIAKHGGDPTRLHLIGHSAGAHHVAILATNERFLQKACVALGDLKSVVELDTQALDVPELMGGRDNDLYLQAFGRDPEVWTQVSPRDNVVKDKGIPPFFLVVADERAPKLAQASVFQKALQAASVRCEFVEAPQHDHGSLNRAIGDKADKVTQAMEKFHDSVLGVMQSATR
jgi:acetyl esterase/lipase